MPRTAARQLLLAVLFLAGSLCAAAQRRLQLSVQSPGGTAIPYADFTLQKAGDTAVFYTGLTDSAGAFNEAILPYDSCTINIRATGFNPAIRPVPADPSKPVLLRITLEISGRALTGVTVSTRKPLLEHRADRTIFNVEGSPSAIGSDALEVLKRAPGIRVTDDDISITGKSTVAVMVNDKLQRLSGPELTELLKSIPAENLSRIEIITTPPAKYDAQGNAGLINLVMKKQLRNGLNGQATAVYNQHTYSGVGGNANFNYRKDRLNIYGTGTANKGRNFQQGIVSSSYPEQQQTQDISSVETYVYNRMQIGVDYNLSPHMVIGALYTVGNGGPKWSTDDATNTTAASLPALNPDSLAQTSAHVHDHGVRNLANLNWEWKLDTAGRKLSADLDYFTRTSHAAQDFITRDFLPDGAPTGTASDNRNEGRQVIDIRSGKLDAEWPTRFAKLSFGGKLSFIHNTSDYLFLYRRGAEYQNDPSRTNAFDYRENTQALYLSGAQSYGKWELQAGLRAEYTQTRGYSPTLGQANTADYFQLFPTAYVQYHASDDHSFGINYSRRIERPDFWHMNPFRFYTTPTSWESGNPYLQPSFSQNLELSYVFKSSYTVTAFAERIAQYSARYSTIDTAVRAIIFTEGNIGTMASYGLSLSANITPVKWWECNVQLRGFTADFQSGFYNAKAPADYSRTAFALDADNTFTLNKAKTLLADLSGEYTSTHLADFDVQQPNWSANAGLKLLMRQGRLIAGISLQDIFRTDAVEFRNLSNGTYQRYYGDERAIRLSLSWKFGNAGIAAKRERRADDADTKRLK